MGSRDATNVSPAGRSATSEGRCQMTYSSLLRGRELGMFRGNESFERSIFPKVSPRYSGAIAGLWPWSYTPQTSTITVRLSSDASLEKYKTGLVALQVFLEKVSRMRIVHNLVLEGFEGSHFHKVPGFLPCLVLQVQLCMWLVYTKRSYGDQEPDLKKFVAGLWWLGLVKSSNDVHIENVSSWVRHPKEGVNILGVIRGNRMPLGYFFLENLLNDFQNSTGLSSLQLFNIIEYSRKALRAGLNIGRLDKFTMNSIRVTVAGLTVLDRSLHVLRMNHVRTFGTDQRMSRIIRSFAQRPNPEDSLWSSQLLDYSDPHSGSDYSDLDSDSGPED